MLPLLVRLRDRLLRPAPYALACAQPRRAKENSPPIYRWVGGRQGRVSPVRDERTLPSLAGLVYYVGPVPTDKSDFFSRDLIRQGFDFDRQFFGRPSLGVSN